MLENGHMLVLLKEEGSQSIRIISRVGSCVPLNWAPRLDVCSSRIPTTGRYATFFAGPLCLRREAPTDVDVLIEQIRKFRRQGYGTELNEANADAGCVSAPVLDGSGRCVAAISVVAPEPRLTRVNRQRLINQVRAAAGRRSRLGAPGA
jgi:IclR family transcriptional regulator, KDG regulon repressor